ncbi:hypothetical protein GGX14DRAFT_397708 [Mycena pura]|uniref:Uncharacterized protein n=1 Tax=Mycena pura TaxID=153505 RepID=A0AAD6VET9_9AGAR|nr:hypothetical protein GGX14DRAFT_397708 [Mycena pura]
MQYVQHRVKSLPGGRPRGTSSVAWPSISKAVSDPSVSCSFEGKTATACACGRRDAELGIGRVTMMTLREERPADDDDDDDADDAVLVRRLRQTQSSATCKAMNRTVTWRAAVSWSGGTGRQNGISARGGDEADHAHNLDGGRGMREGAGYGRGVGLRVACVAGAIDGGGGGGGRTCSRRGGTKKSEKGVEKNEGGAHRERLGCRRVVSVVLKNKRGGARTQGKRLGRRGGEVEREGRKTCKSKGSLYASPAVRTTRQAVNDALRRRLRAALPHKRARYQKNRPEGGFPQSIQRDGERRLHPSDVWIYDEASGPESWTTSKEDHCHCKNYETASSTVQTLVPKLN